MGTILDLLKWLGDKLFGFLSQRMQQSKLRVRAELRVQPFARRNSILIEIRATCEGQQPITLTGLFIEYKDGRREQPPQVLVPPEIARVKEDEWVEVPQNTEPLKPALSHGDMFTWGLPPLEVVPQAKRVYLQDTFDKEWPISRRDWKKVQAEYKEHGLDQDYENLLKSRRQAAAALKKRLDPGGETNHLSD